MAIPLRQVKADVVLAGGLTPNSDVSLKLTFNPTTLYLHPGNIVPTTDIILQDGQQTPQDAAVTVKTEQADTIAADGTIPHTSDSSITEAADTLSTTSTIPHTAEAFVVPAVWDGTNISNATRSNLNRTITRSGVGGELTYKGVSDKATTPNQKVYIELVVDDVTSILEGNWIGGFTNNQSDFIASGIAAHFIGIQNFSGNVYDTDSPDHGADIVPNFTTGDQLDIALDVALARVWVRKNGGAWNPDFGGSQDPETGTGGIRIGFSGPYYAAISAGWYDGHQTSAKFAASDWTNTAPAGFSELGEYTAEAADTVASAGTVPVNAEFSKTEQADTIASDAAVAVQGDLSKTEQADTIAADGTIPHTADASITEAADTLSTTSTIPHTADASITDSADTLSAAGTIPINGAASITETADTSTADGAVAVQGTASITEAADTLTTDSTIPHTADSSITEAADTISATGSGEVTTNVNLDKTEQADTIASAGVQGDLNGTASITETADTSTAAGTIPVNGAASITETADTSTAAGTIPVNGALSKTEQADTISTAGTVAVQGDLSKTEAADTIAAAGTIPIRGTLSATEQADTSTAAGTIPVNGDLSKTEQTDTISAAGTIPVNGDASITEAADTLSSDSSVAVQGTLSKTEHADTILSNAGELPFVVGDTDLLEAADSLAFSGFRWIKNIQQKEVELNTSQPVIQVYQATGPGRITTVVKIA